MCGRPGLAHIVDEVAAIGSDRAVVVHHPYYTPLIDWTRQVLAPGALARYRALTNQLPVKPRPADHLRVDFIAQRGRYADVTSVLNGAEHLRTGEFYVVFADNVDPTHAALSALTETPLDTAAVLAAPFDVDAASNHGVIVCAGEGPVLRMAGLIEKPDRQQAARLEAERGTANLRLLHGRLRVTPDLLDHLAIAGRSSTSEPKLSLALASYARSNRVDVVTSTQPFTDLGLSSPGGAVQGDDVPLAMPRS